MQPEENDNPERSGEASTRDLNSGLHGQTTIILAAAPHSLFLMIVATECPLKAITIMGYSLQKHFPSPCKKRKREGMIGRGHMCNMCLMCAVFVHLKSEEGRKHKNRERDGREPSGSRGDQESHDGHDHREV
ncbi:hypothetical protein XELAEV_18012906mg [Xenopus laevis]|uniref:Uncharacterized protein n=1 Tax=Xenopus laevis TaxID=8355 RepID=A0A974HZ48_XENLA|nr:hypothetical protein XELAEV_18012906mg [Xenopus laevis]